MKTDIYKCKDGFEFSLPFKTEIYLSSECQKCPEDTLLHCLELVESNEEDSKTARENFCEIYRKNKLEF
jgi:hypothetical protein